ncbi:MAG TPA: polysialyltransferase family glycosyltransferase [Bacteroidales bacterium]|nr:polysialyltransferase family glycosyltransferase [Bacteroidales bacterium]
MIYFLINNTFHQYTTNLLIKTLKEPELGLIQIPYSLNPVLEDVRFKKIITLEKLPHSIEYLKNFPRLLIKLILRNHKIVTEAKKKIKPGKKDILFVFTETELLNSIIINTFKRKRATIFLIEDGLASYLYYNMKSDPFSKRVKALKVLIRLVYGLKGFSPFNVNGYFYPQISDKYFSGICYFYPITIKRQIQVFKLMNPVKPLIFNSKYTNAIFLSQPIYYRFVSLDNYLVSLDLIFSNIASCFAVIYVKLHPDERDNGIGTKISGITKKYSNVRLIHTSDIVENIIQDINTSYAISFSSTALMSLAFFGIEPIYLYHLFNFMEGETSQYLTTYLKTLNYNFPQSFLDIKPGYKSGLLDRFSDGMALSDLICSVNNTE